ncbi:polymorphic toxin type 50 domain-containing protein [Psychrobacillus sp. FSL W7-1493]|uniref:polymorphic toxin type 50 domain-containing protein n=1 Tax=Psychrobacillus sp. FSL W7-1493 TaxID=2921552 RepID=UPI0030FB7338
MALPHLDDSAVQEGVITSKKKRDDTVQQLNEFDYSQTVSLNPVEQDLRVLQDCLIEMEGLFQNGLSDIHFQTSQWSVNPARKRLVWDLATRESTLPLLKKYPLTEELSSMLQTYLQRVSPISFGLSGQVSRPNVFMGPAVNHSNGNPLHLNFWKNNLISSMEQLISAKEVQILINQAVNVKKVTDEYGSFSEESVIEGTYYTLPDGKIIRQYYGRTGAQQYKYVQNIPEERIGSGKTLEDIFPPITKIEEFLIGDIIAMSEDPSSESVAEAALFTVFKPFKMVDKVSDVIKDGKKKIEKIEDKGKGNGVPSYGKNSVPIGPYREVNGFPAKVKPGSQEKHIPNTPNYKQELANGKIKSIFYGDNKKAQVLLDKYAGKGQLLPNGKKERVDFSETIGKYYDVDTGEYLETTRGIIHYGKDGAHIVPSEPLK